VRHRQAVLTAVSALLAALAALCSHPLCAQEKEPEAPPIAWQKDLESALKESYLTGRPLLLHFCPEGRIALNEDMSTYQDNRVRTWAVHFVWLRLDPKEFQKLADEYGVKEVPSLVAVSHEKKKLNSKNVEGHAFPEDVEALLKDVLKKSGKIPKPKDIEKLRKDFDEAQEQLKKKEMKKAVQLLRKISRSKLEIGFVIEAGKALKAIESDAKQKIEQAKKLFAEGKKDEGDGILKEIEASLRGLDVAAEARKVRLELYKSENGAQDLLKEEQEKRAQQTLKLAKMYEENKKPENALEEYEKILKEYPGTEAAAEAADRATELRRVLGKEEDK
jgi:tetratricopeptide (TPR) repeat protein